MARTRDRDIDIRAAAYLRRQRSPLAITQSKTKRPYFLVRPGVPSAIAGLSVDCKAYTADIDIDCGFVGLTARISPATLTVHSVAEQLATGAFVARVGGKAVEKGAATAITFTAAHVVTASKYGVIVLQMDNAGAISSKVVATPQAYDSAAAALAARPSADADKVELGYIVIANNAGDWTANTDDLTNGSDLTTATFTNHATEFVSALSATISPEAFKPVEATLSATPSALLDNTGAKDIMALVTTDGTAAITEGYLDLAWRGTR